MLALVLLLLSVLFYLLSLLHDSYVSCVTSVVCSVVAVGVVVVASVGVSVGLVFVVVSSVLCSLLLPFLCCAGRCFSKMVVMPVDNISARSEQCHDKYDITILAYSSFSILVIPLLPLN